MPRILAFAGSLRRDSFNKKLVGLAAEGAGAQGAEVEIVDLADFPLPLYDQDLEDSEGLPPNAVRLKDLFIGADGFLIASPEYNGSFSAALKNAIDWVSRPRKGDAPRAGFSGKVAGLVATSPGALGGLRGLVHVRAVLSNLGVLVLPDQVAVPKASAAFDDTGDLIDPATKERVLAVGRRVVEVADRLTS